MSAWQPPSTEHSAEEPLLPFAFNEHVELLRASDAVTAALRRRVEQIVGHGYTREHDLDQPIDFLVRQAEGRLRAFIDYSGRGQMHPPPERRDQMIGKVEIAIALLLGAWDRMHADPSEVSEGED